MPYLPPFLRTNLTGWFRVDAFDLATILAPVWKDLSGNGNDLVGSAFNPPGDFLGSTLYVGPALSQFVSVSNGTILMAVRIDDIVASTAVVTNQDCLWCSSTLAGAYLRDNGGVRTYTAQNNDGSSDVVIITPANGLPDGEIAIVLWDHAGGATLGGSVDDLLRDTIASGATTTAANAFRLGLNSAGTAGLTGKVLEILTWNNTFTDEKRSQAINYLAANWTRRGAPIHQARSRASRRLWEFRTTPVLPRLDRVPLDVMDAELLADLTAVHPYGLRPSGAGWGEENYERGEVRILERSLDVDGMALTVVGRDLRRHRCTLALGCIPVLGGNVERGDGLLVLTDQLRVESISTSKSWLLGGANQFVEARSSTERLLLAAVEDGVHDAPYNDGMLLESTITNKLLRSSFVNGTTGLTLTGSGASGRLISATTPAEPMFDSSVTPNQLSFDGGTVPAALHAAWPVVAMGASEKFCLAAWMDSNGSNFLQYQLQRSVDNFFWDAGTGTWVVGSTWNTWSNASHASPFTFLQKPAPNPRYAYKTALIDYGGSAGNLTVRIGEASCAINEVKNLYHVQLQGSAVVTTPVVTTTATVTRAESCLVITPWYGGTASVPANGVPLFATDGGSAISSGSYTVLAELVPLWNAVDVPASGVKTLLNQQFAADSSRVWMYWDKATASWRWTTSGDTLSFASNPVRDQRVKLAFRMTDPADGGGPALAKALFLDGVQVASGSTASNLVAIGADTAFVGKKADQSASANNQGLDSILRRLVVVPYAMTAAEIAAW